MTYTRRNLPHLYFEYGIYFVTFRLFGSLPRNVLFEINSSMEDDESKMLFKKYDDMLDSGNWESKYLANDEIAAKVKYCIHYSDGEEYNLICYSIMSNHVHILFELLENNKGLSKIMQSIKGISARESNKLLNRKGKFWQDESYDRLVRNENEFYRILKYVLMNPVKAGLVENWKDWKNNYCNPEYMDFMHSVCSTL